MSDFEWTYDIVGEVRITDNSQLKVGDRVRFESATTLEIPNQYQLGVIIVVEDCDDGFYLVRFDVRFDDGLHYGDENEDPTSSSYYFQLDAIEKGHDVIYRI